MLPGRQNEQLQQQLHVLQLLTALHVEVDGGSQATCSCKAEEVDRALSFKVDLAPADEDAGEGDIAYTPCDGDLERLPDYLQEEITCARPATPRLARARAAARSPC